MEKRDPKKRRSIHGTAVPVDEITDNVRNDSKNLRSRNAQIDEMDAPDEFYNLSSDSAELSESLATVRGRTRSTSSPYTDSLSSDEEEEQPRKRRIKPRVKPDVQFFNQEDVRFVDPSRSEKRSNLNNKQIKNTPIDRYYNSWKIQDETSNFSTITKILFFLVIVSLIVLAFAYQYDSGDVKSDIRQPDDVLANVVETIKSMRSRYKNQKINLWQDVYASIASIIKNPSKPSIVVLIGNKADPLDCLSILIGNLSSNAMNSDKLLLQPENFQTDMGSVITSLRSSLKDKKAVIIWDLLNINVEALKAFHNLCDRINPLVEEVYYIITIIADDFDNESNPLEFVQKELVKKLSGKMKDDAIHPLITRITDGPILAVKPEPTVTDCPLPKVSKKS